MPRMQERFDASVPVNLEGGGRGQTLNLSATGVFFVTDEPIANGGAIRFTIEFDSPAGKFLMDCTGEIMRLEKSQGKVGVAARILETRMERRLDRPHATPKQGAHA